ncbi:Lsr2 family protein [Microbacterium sp. SLBN-146]|uniref:histone-like nucleoid-structuring protein Lsr2 n=1 Tax=Microbacterium sp. SLBN-146 TaxID=2768457 RepID=UPI0011506A38|nr:Lsr2 family protein [Microbacterium sp. SLBN-146]TQJ31553.1 Lsr2 protein [Microbacterium sp. SLBN-146]
MAREVTVTLIDDLDGTPIAEGNGETITFALRQKSYEIDLTSKNIQKLEAALEPFVKAARAPEKTQSAAPKRRTRSNGSRDLTEVRTWARANGYTLSDRGRVPAPILEAYDAANR